MKNAGMAGAVAMVGIGLISIALSNVVTAPQAVAAPIAELGVLLASWGDAPRSPVPASDCPLGLMP